MSKVKLVVLDMDGTAYHHLGEVIEENIEPLIEAQKKGVIVSFVTGRPVFAPHNKIIEHGFAEHGPSIIAACNGGVIYDIKNQKILQDNSIPKEIVKKLFELLEKPKNKDVEVFAYSNDFNIAYINKSFEESKFMEIEKKFFEHEYKIVNSKSDLLPCFKFLVFNFSQEFEKDLLDLGLEIWAKPGGYVGEVNLKGVNKKLAVDYLCNEFNITPNEVLAMGDGPNDFPMMNYVGYPIAPSNAFETIKKVSKEVLDISNTQGAVAFAVKKYVLKGE